MDDKDIGKLAFSWVRPFLEETFGKEPEAWHTRPEEGSGKRVVVFTQEACQKFLGR